MGTNSFSKFLEAELYNNATVSEHIEQFTVALLIGKSNEYWQHAYYIQAKVWKSGESVRMKPNKKHTIWTEIQAHAFAH